MGLDWLEKLQLFGAVLVGIPLALLMIYLVSRMVALAFFQSWWDARTKNYKKLLDSPKENPKGGSKNDRG